jgi:hypothetical protein
MYVHILSLKNKNKREMKSPGKLLPTKLKKQANTEDHNFPEQKPTTRAMPNTG